MTSLRVSLMVPLLSLIFISGVEAQDGFGVTYSPNSLCALKGSAVNLGCSYRFPGGHSVQKTSWSKTPSVDVGPPDLSDDPEYTGRIQSLVDEESDCTIKLKDVREEDQRKYYFRFLTDKGGKHLGGDGVDLSVTGLQVEGPERVTEGDKVTLTCKTTCSLTVRPTFYWFRDGSPLSSSTDQLLHLQSVSSEDEGRYRCAVVSPKLQSPEVTLKVNNRIPVGTIIGGIIGGIIGAVFLGVIAFCLIRKWNKQNKQGKQDLQNKPVESTKEPLRNPHDLNNTEL